MRKNRFVSDEFRETYRNQTGMDFPEDRRSGKTFGIAIRAIGEAMTHPGMGVCLINHEPDTSPAHREALIRTVQSVIARLDLKYLNVSKPKAGPPVLTYDVFEERD